MELFCKDCKHLDHDLGSWGIDIAVRYCHHPSNGINICSGKINSEFAAVVRRKNKCGPSGRLFEKKKWFQIF